MNSLPHRTLVLFLMVVATISFFLLFAPLSLRLDEAQSLWQSSRSLEALFNFLSSNVHVPFYHMTLHYWQSLFGNSALAIRSLSFLFFLASIPALYGLGRAIYGKSTALLATFLFALSPFMHWFSSEARMYTLLVLITIASHYFYLRFLKQERKDTWIMYTLVSVLGMYTHYFFALLLLSQAVFFVTHARRFTKRSFRMLALTAGIVCAALIPWLVRVLTASKLDETAPLLATPTTIDFFNVFSNFYFGFQPDYINSLLLSFWPLVILFAFLALRRAGAPRIGTSYLLTTVAVPLAVSLVISIFLEPIFLSRYLIFTLPALMLLTSSIVCGFTRATALGVSLVFIVLMVTTLGIQARSPDIAAKEDYRAAAEYMNQHVTARDVIIISASFTIYPVHYYYEGPARITTLPTWNRYDGEPLAPYSEEEVAIVATELAKTHEHAWLLLSYNQGQEQAIREYFDTHFERVDAVSIGGNLDLYSYKLRYDVDYVEDLVSTSPRF